VAYHTAALGSHKAAVHGVSKQLAVLNGPGVSMPGLIDDFSVCDDFSSGDVGSGVVVATFDARCWTEPEKIEGEIVFTQMNVKSPCHCQRVAVSEADNGVLYWSYHETNQECILFSSRGSLATCTSAETGWVSGHLGMVRLTGHSAAEVAGNTAFSLDISGHNFPGQGSPHATTADRQRIKIVEATESCQYGDMIPHIKGARCTGNKVCSPKPAHTSSTSATWNNLQIGNTEVDTSYKVCYNMGRTYNSVDWLEVPGLLKVTKSGYTYQLLDAVDEDIFSLTRQSAGNKIVISRPGLGVPDTTDSNTWAVDFIQSKFSCGVNPVDDFIAATTAANADDVTMTLTLPNNFPVDDYIICLSVGGGPSFAIPSAEGDQTVELVGEAGYSPKTAQVYGNQRASMSRNELDNMIKLKGFGLMGLTITQSPAHADIKLLSEDCDGGATLRIVSYQSKTDTEIEWSVSGLLNNANADLPAGEYKFCVLDREVARVTVTDRFHLNNNWVLTPGTDQAIEVTGADLSIRRDRIMVISCDGSCGVSGPTDALNLSLADYLGESPVNNLVDPPMADDELGYIPDDDTDSGVTWAAATDGKYCLGKHVSLASLDAAEIELIHSMTCFAQCADGTSTSDNCNGYFHGYDDSDSLSLCTTLAAAQAVFKDKDYVQSFDNHKTLNRLFLNTGTCSTDDLEDDSQYEWVNKVVPAPSRRLTRKVSALDGRKRRLTTDVIAAPTDNSWSKLLAFDSPFHFANGGTFKVCVCDSAVVYPNEKDFCNKVSDFKVDLGTVHVSGVSCLVSENKFQRGVCVEQKNSGGLRCYDTAAPTLALDPAPATPTHPDPVDDDDDDDDDNNDPTVTAWCLYGPEEDTEDNANCARIRRLHGMA